LPSHAPPRWRGRTSIAGLLLACVVGMALPPLATASTGALTYAAVGQDQKHGAITGSVTWDQCTKASVCWWAPFVLVKPAAEPCSVDDITQAGQLEKGEASTPIYLVWGDGGWTENGTVKVGEIGFPAVVGQQACLFVSYKTGPGDGGSEQRQDIPLASRAFVLEQHPLSPNPISAAAPTLGPTPTAPSTSAPTAATPQPLVQRTLPKAQKLRHALAHCRRRFHRRHSRIACERQARKKYGIRGHTG
jgi:hypothetical protein